MVRTLTLLISLFVLFVQSSAQPGTLDPGFAISGRLITNIAGGGFDEAWAVTEQPDGKIILAGTSGFEDAQDFAVVRYLANGTPDPDFGTNGIVLTSIAPANDVARTILVQSDGRILVGGYAYRPEGLCFALVRYESNGDPDMGFGTNGIVVTDLNGATVQGLALAMQDNKIILAGGGNMGFAMVRYDANGDIDESFGTDGLATCSFTNGNDLAAGIALQSDGHIVLAGYSSGNADSIAVARFSSDGLLDMTFGNGGRAKATVFGAGGTIGRSLALDAQDRILVAGTTPLEAVVVRFTADGQLDDTFNGTGIRELPVDDADATNGYAVAVDGDGNVLVAGRVVQASTDLLLFRLTTDGTNDATFDGDGLVTTSFNDLPCAAHAIALQADGRILLAGSMDFDHGDYAFVGARYLIAEQSTGISTITSGDEALRVSPMPLAQSSVLRFTLERSDAVSIDLCDARGAWMRRLRDRTMAGPGTYTLSLAGLGDLAPGVYFIRLRGDATDQVLRVVK